MSMLIYVVMAFWAGLGLVLNTRLSSMLATALAPTGALMTFIALWTGALWGKPTWGTWWVWDARLTSELLLLFLYLGFMALQAAADDPRRADRAGAIVALVGVVNVPIIYFSVKWWNTLHQGSTINMTKAPSMASIMLVGMLLMVFAFWAYSIAAALQRVRAIILEREKDADWVTRLKEAVMHWQSVGDFLAMGGYGLYVWGSFGVTAVVLVWELVMLGQRRRRALAEVRNWRLLQGDANGGVHDATP
jgi:heme exporter protein C